MDWWDVGLVVWAVVATALLATVVRRRHEGRALADLRRREQQALELNDNVLQGLVVATMSLDLGQQDKARDALDSAIVSASHLVTDLLGPGRQPVAARLLRRTAAGTEPGEGPASDPTPGSRA